MELENIVDNLNKGIDVMDVIVISDGIEELINGGYIEKREARFLFQDILNDRCRIPLSSFKEDK